MAKIMAAWAWSPRRLPVLWQGVQEERWEVKFSPEESAEVAVAVSNNIGANCRACLPLYHYPFAAGFTHIQRCQLHERGKIWTGQNLFGGVLFEASTKSFVVNILSDICTQACHTITTLSYAIRFWSKGTKRALDSWRHEGFLYVPSLLAC